ncbi:membrane protein DedA, SNARE-associated domain [Propionibacterium cyclohexanicum]|uniref:Membrane protein DedA, SNARE-associated domain n=2 Tax=Propionibacterium cyclohexanicum TaxID=64702 RepID=A0A1H9U1M3_9ACTN|nr:membrane protein DedA, SNARE-associated domain [Propionibacterium cyclohexanicum]
MPWRQKPGRADFACLAWMGVLGVVSMAMLPVRAWLLGSPDRIPLLVALTGSRSGTVSLGALVHTGQYSVVWGVGQLIVHLPWIVPVIAGTIMSCKFDWVYWWAGKLWGRGMIEVWAGKSPRARHRYERMERWAAKMGWLGIVIAYLPIPLPLMPVVFVLAGASGMSVKRFMALDLTVCLAWLLGFVALGAAGGAPVETALGIYAKVANFVTIALIVAIVAWTFVRSSKKTRTPAKN